MGVKRVKNLFNMCVVMEGMTCFKAAQLEARVGLNGSTP